MTAETISPRANMGDTAADQLEVGEVKAGVSTFARCAVRAARISITTPPGRCFTEWRVEVSSCCRVIFADSMFLIVAVTAGSGATPVRHRFHSDPGAVTDAKHNNPQDKDEDAPLPCGHHADDDREDGNNDRYGSDEHSRSAPASATEGSTWVAAGGLEGAWPFELTLFAATTLVSSLTLDFDRTPAVTGDHAAEPFHSPPSPPPPAPASVLPPEAPLPASPLVPRGFAPPPAVYSARSIAS